MPVSRVAATMSVKKKPVRKPKVAKKKPPKDENVGFCGNQLSNKIAHKFQELRDAKWFQTAIIMVIFVAGALVGIQTYDVEGKGISAIDQAVLIIFIIELVVKFIAEGRYPQRFFHDSWNVFDFVIVVVGLLPIGGENTGAVTSLRLIRLLRVLKLVRALPKLRILVMGLLKSMSSIAYIGLLLMLLFYLYAVLGVSLFGPNDPIFMGTLHNAFLTLFRCATLEDWTDVMYTAMYGCENYGYTGAEDKCVASAEQPLLSVAYFVTFIVLSSMMILNLFIGVITSSMQDAKTELMAELEAEMAAKDEGNTNKVEIQLKELENIFAQLEDEVTLYAELEKEHQASALVTLSTKQTVANVEVIVTAKDVKKIETNLKNSQSDGSLARSMSKPALLAGKTPSGSGGTPQSSP